MIPIAGALFAATLVVTAALLPVSCAWARRLGLLDHPGGRKTHAGPIPLSGGWAVLGGFLIATLGCLGGAALAARWDWPVPYVPDFQYFALNLPLLLFRVAPVLAGAVAIFALGAVDDLRGLRPGRRLAWQAAVGFVVSCYGFRPTLDFLPLPAQLAVGTLWIVGITNAYNLIDGLDGLCGGLGLIATGTLACVAAINRQPLVLYFSAALAGALLAFVAANFHPAKVFLGSAGSLLVGYFIALLSVLVTYLPPDGGGGTWLAPLLTPLVLSAVPIYDTASVILIRLRERRPLFLADRSHFHHRLLRRGFGHRSAVLFIWAIGVSLAISALLLARASAAQTVVILIQTVAILGALILAERGWGGPRPEPAPASEPEPSTSSEWAGSRKG